MLKNHKELEVWQRSFDLCKSVYRASSRFPTDERFGLTAQIRRCAISVPSNTAEGYNRGGTKDYIRFLWIANGSLAELETQLLLAKELAHADGKDLESAIEETQHIERMLRSMIRSLQAKVSKR